MEFKILFCWSVYLSVSVPIPHSVCFYIFILLKLESINRPIVFILFKIVLLSLSFLNFLIKFQTSLPISTKKQAGALKLFHWTIDQFRKTLHLNTIKSSDSLTWRPLFIYWGLLYFNKVFTILIVTLLHFNFLVSYIV